MSWTWATPSMHPNVFFVFLVASVGGPAPRAETRSNRQRGIPPPSQLINGSRRGDASDWVLLSSDSHVGSGGWPYPRPRTRDGSSLLHRYSIADWRRLLWWSRRPDEARQPAALLPPSTSALGRGLSVRETSLQPGSPEQRSVAAGNAAPSTGVDYKARPTR